jgi:hypothetical protein
MLPIRKYPPTAPQARDAPIFHIFPGENRTLDSGIMIRQYKKRHIAPQQSRPRHPAGQRYTEGRSMAKREAKILLIIGPEVGLF